jgi:aspartate/methionine/tyrosine aminotransferase
MLVINRVSKTYAMTGWRIGYAAGAPSIIAAINVLQSQSHEHAIGGRFPRNRRVVRAHFRRL